MKTWNTPAIEELELNKTMAGGTTLHHADGPRASGTGHAIITTGYISGQPDVFDEAHPRYW